MAFMVVAFMVAAFMVAAFMMIAFMVAGRLSCAALWSTHRPAQDTRIQDSGQGGRRWVAGR